MGHFKVVICITVNNIFIVDSLTNIGYTRLPKQSTRNDGSVEFFERVLADEDLNSMCEIRNSLAGIHGIVEVQCVVPRYIKTNKKTKFLRELPHTAIIALAALFIIIGINITHENILKDIEMATIGIAPIATDLIYTCLRVVTSK